MTEMIVPPPKPEIVLIAAIARNGMIGAQGKLPWHIPGDLKRFKAETLGHPVIMGRKTFVSIGAALPGRDTIVLTKQASFQADNVFTVLTPQAALDCALDCGRKRKTTRLVIAGGAEIYALFLPIAARMILTRVDLDVEGDTRFPAFHLDEWNVEAQETGPRGPKDDASYSITEYRRKQSVPISAGGIWQWGT